MRHKTESKLIGSQRHRHTKYIKLRPLLVILIVLVPYFTCTTGFLDQTFGLHKAVTLNSEGAQNEAGIIHDQDSYAAKWLEQYREKEEIIYTSDYGTEVLGSQGKIPRSQVNTKLFFTYEEEGKIEGYIYLRYLQVVDGKIITSGGGRQNMAELSDMLEVENKIYATNGSEIYR